MRRRWEKNCHCFWCGVETVWTEKMKGRPPDNMATIDHIRSRWCKTRSDKDNWQPGLWVLACFKCNNERGAMEAAWVKERDPERFYELGNSKPSGYELQQTQQKLSTALIRFLNAGGTLLGDDKHIAQLTRLAKRLEYLYRQHNIEKRAPRYASTSLGKLLDEARENGHAMTRTTEGGR